VISETVPIRVHMQYGLVVAVARVGSRVFLSQGPPLAVQLQHEPHRTPICVGVEVEKSVRFASVQARR